jgi:hypothetical protein
MADISMILGVKEISSNLKRTKNEVRVRLTLRLAVCRQSVRLGVKALETHDQILFYFNRILAEKLCKQQAEVIQNHENEYVSGIGQGEAKHRKY